MPLSIINNSMYNSLYCQSALEEENMNQCLLIKIKDNRRFLTHEKNLPSLIEFAKTFGAEIFLVEPKEGQKIFDLKPLTIAICNSDETTGLQYKKIDKIFPKSKRKRQDILAEAQKIRNFIENRLLVGKPISLKELKKKYKKFDLTDACLCNHLSMARKMLTQRGFKFQKTGGSYCLS